MFSYEFVQKINYHDELLNFGTILEVDIIENKVTTNSGVAIFERGKDTFVFSPNNSNKQYTISDCSIFLTHKGLFNTFECKIKMGDEVNYCDTQGILIGIGFFNIVTHEFSITRTRLSDCVCALIEISNDETIALMKSNLMLSWNSFNFKTGTFKAAETDLSMTSFEAVECYIADNYGEQYEF